MTDTSIFFICGAAVLLGLFAMIAFGGWCDSRSRIEDEDEAEDEDEDEQKS